MEIVSDFQLAIANLVMALQTNAVSVEQRLDIQNTVGDDLGKLMEVVDALLFSHGNRVLKKKWDAKKASMAVRMEYREMGLNKVLDYQHLRGAVELYFASKEQGNTYNPLEHLKEVFAQNGDCTDLRIKAGVDSLCLRLLFRYKIVKADLEFTKELMERINGYSREERDAAMLPHSIMDEL